MAIEEEIQRTRKTEETKNAEPFGSGVTHVKHEREAAVQETEAKKIQGEIMDLKIAKWCLSIEEVNTVKRILPGLA